MPEFYPRNFGALPPELSDLDQAKVVVLPVPYDVTTTFQKGTHVGPAALIEASRQMELWDDELAQDTSRIGIHTAEELHFENISPEHMVRDVKDAVAHFLAMDKTVVMLGGEHSITFGAVTAHAARYKDLSVVQFDAHADLRDTYHGSPFNHACIMRRLVGAYPCVQLGIRNFSEEEHHFIRDNKLPVFSAERCLTDDSWHEAALEPLTENVYLTIDLDAFDSAVMPSTGTPEPGGLDWYTVLRFVRKLAKKKRIVGFDVVEMMPIGNLGAPNFLAAKLVYRVLGYMFPQ